MADCVPDARYLASPDFIATTLHYFTLVEIPVLTFGAYCILFKTPPQMNSVKFLMLNLHFWSALSDLVISCFGIPYILLPAPAGYGLGIINAPAVLIYCLVTLLGALTAAVMAIYENRYYSLFGKYTFWKHIRKFYLFLVFSLVPVFFLPPYFNIPEQEYARSVIHQMLPCLPPFTYHDHPLFVIALSYDLPIYCVASMMVILAVSISVFCVLTIHHMWGKALLTKLSMRTLRMQKSFALALTVQSVFMLSVVLTPVLIILWIIVKWHHDQALNNFVFITFSLHGVGSTIVMIFVHKPYRDFTFCCIPACQKNERDAKQNNLKGIPPSVIL